MNERIRAILMGLQITIRVDAAAAVGEINDMAARAQNMDPMLHRAADILRSDAELQFKVGGIPSWQPLAPSTVSQKRAQGTPRLNRRGQKGEWASQSLGPYGKPGIRFGPTAILIRTGALFSSWTNAQDPDHVEITEGDTVKIGTTIPYALVHQQGGGRVPKRPVTVTDEAKRQIEREASDYISKGTIKKK